MSGHNSLMKQEATTEIIPFDETPDYLEGAKNRGMENIGKDDVKTPRILLLQALSPQIQNFPGVAHPGQFWHTGMNVPLGPAFDFVTALVSKRVILWRPREDQGGGILAFSRNGKTWDTGANQEFRVKIKGRKEPVIWKTGPDVISSKLTNFGTYNPDDNDSPPAASLVYEYLIYLIRNPELSPVVFGVSKTGVPNAKAFNTALLTLQNAHKPIQSVAVRCTAEEQKSDVGQWTVPSFKPIGMVNREVFEKVSKMTEDYGDYKVEYAQDDVEATSEVIDDNVNY